MLPTLPVQEPGRLVLSGKSEWLCLMGNLPDTAVQLFLIFLLSRGTEGETKSWTKPLRGRNQQPFFFVRTIAKQPTRR